MPSLPVHAIPQDAGLDAAMEAKDGPQAWPVLGIATLEKHS